MPESADQPLLTEPSNVEAPKKPQRGTAPKPRATAKIKAASPPEKVEAAPRKRAVRKKPASADGDLPGLNETPAVHSAQDGEASSGQRETKPEKAAVGEPKPAEARAPRRRRAPSAEATAATAATAAAASRGGHTEEWSPSRPQSSAGEASPAAEKRMEPPPVANLSPPPASAREALPATEPAPARKYPVYIPRHVAKQMEEQGQTAPIAVPADAIPEAARAAVEAAKASVHASHAPSLPRPDQSERRERDFRDPRPERGERPDRHDRHDRRNRGRHERPDRPDRGDSPDRFDSEREEARYSEQPLGESLGEGEGIVEISGKGFGFIRDAKRGFTQHPQDIFVTPEQVRRYNLRDGQWIKGEIRRGGRGAQLSQLLELNGADPEGARVLPAFDELTVISPMERIVLETTPERTTTRIIDLFAPIGKGQRGIIVAPPRTGKTTFLQHIGDAVVKLHPDIKLIILLIDERPEEVTDIRRTVSSAEVMASSNDSDVKSHTRIAQLAIERAKRLVESGHDVFILLDSITRVGRAFNNALAGGGRTGSGGLDNRALEIPRRLFAAARNTEEAGSLTIIATALIETGSMMDDRIFQEFKGTGNMELVLDRKISEQRLYPAIDIFQSGTRREELLIPADDLHKISLIRRGLAGHKPMEAIERLLFFLKKFPTNAQMLAGIPG